MHRARRGPTPFIFVFYSIVHNKNSAFRIVKFRLSFVGLLSEQKCSEKILEYAQG